MATIGFIGLGHMGHPMVVNLLKHQHQVKIFDAVPAAIEALTAKGAIGTASAIAAAEDCQVVFTMLQTGEQVMQTCLGENGIFTHLKPNSMYIDCSSIDIQTTQYLHQQAAHHHIAMLDAPVSGGVKGAEQATLTLMVGGDKAHFTKAEPLLLQLGKLAIHAGKPGCGAAAKICNNMILGISMIAVSEGFILAEKLGLNAKNFFDIASHASGECWAMTHYCPVPNVMEGVPANNDYKPGFTAAMMLKDLLLSQAAAEQVNLKTCMGSKAKELYQQFVDQGAAQVDFSGIIQLLSSCSK